MHVSIYAGLRLGASRFSFTRTRHVGRATARERAAMATRRRRLSSPRAAAGDHPRSGSHVTDARAPAPILIGCACLRCGHQRIARSRARRMRPHAPGYSTHLAQAIFSTTVDFLFPRTSFLPLTTVIGEMLRDHFFARKC